MLAVLMIQKEYKRFLLCCNSVIITKKERSDVMALSTLTARVDDIERNGAMHGIGDPEPLRGNLNFKDFG